MEAEGQLTRSFRNGLDYTFIRHLVSQMLDAERVIRFLSDPSIRLFAMRKPANL